MHRGKKRMGTSIQERRVNSFKNKKIKKLETRLETNIKYSDMLKEEINGLIQYIEKLKEEMSGISDYCNYVCDEFNLMYDTLKIHAPEIVDISKIYREYREGLNTGNYSKDFNFLNQLYKHELLKDFLEEVNHGGVGALKTEEKYERILKVKQRQHKIDSVLDDNDK
jgi:hypothetical protein